MKLSGWILALLAGPSALGCDWDSDDRRFAEESEPPAAASTDFRHDPFSVATTTVEEHSASSRPAIESQWNRVRFVSPGGRPVQYRAVFDSDFGAVVIDLRPDWAPNHVRHFVALARAGVCNKLSLEPGDDSSPHRCSLPLPYRLEYRLKPEPTAPAHLDPGAIGFTGSPADNAMPRFYINLGPGPDSDCAATAFGQVVLGMETLRRMNRGGHRIDIRSVTIQAREITP